MFKLKNFDKGDVISYGMIGTTYKAIDKSTGKEADEIIIKVEKFIPRYRSWCLENAFAFEMGSLYPQHFTQLYDSETVSDCDHIQKYARPLDKMPPHKQKEFEELAQSKWCIYRIYARIDTTLAKMSGNHPIQQTYSMLAQMIYIIEVMQYRGWLHDDLHANNIGIKYTNETHIELGDVTVPTFGKRYYAIDYGNVKHKIFSNPKPDPRFNDIKMILNWVVKSSDFWEHAKPIPFEDATNKFKKLKLDIKINPPDDNILHTAILLTQPEVFQKIVSPTTEKFYPIELHITREDVLFYAANWSNTSGLKHYFASKAGS